MLSKKSRAYRLIALFLAWSMLVLGVMAPIALSLSLGLMGLYLALGIWAGGYLLVGLVNELVIYFRRKRNKE